MTLLNYYFIGRCPNLACGLCVQAEMTDQAEPLTDEELAVIVKPQACPACEDAQITLAPCNKEEHFKQENEDRTCAKCGKVCDSPDDVDEDGLCWDCFVEAGGIRKVLDAIAERR